jgi:dTMP kinase
MRGLFITFEGVEGAGKSTQAALLRDALRSRGLQVCALREPGGTPIGESIRSLLLSEKDPVTLRAELLLFLAARAQLVEMVIRPRLAVGETVICDRYIDSTTAYQGYARENDLDLVMKMNEFATGGLKPDVTFLLDLDPSVGLDRQKERNRMEAEAIAFHERVREGFLAIARAEPDRVIIIDAGLPAVQLQEMILHELSVRLPAGTISKSVKSE